MVVLGLLGVAGLGVEAVVGGEVGLEAGFGEESRLEEGLVVVGVDGLVDGFGVEGEGVIGEGIAAGRVEIEGRVVI